MLQVGFINYRRTIIDRFAFPDKSTELFNIPYHIDVEAGFQSSKSTIAENGMGVTFRP